MGHRSSKQTAGLTDGNTSNNNNSSANKNTTTKLNKQSIRRHSTRFPKSRLTKSDDNNTSDKKNYRHTIATTSNSCNGNSNSSNDNSNSNSNIAAALYEDNQFLPILQLETEPTTENTTAAAVVNNSTGGQIIIKIRFKTHSLSEMDNTQQPTQTTSESPSETERPTLVLQTSETYRLLTDTNSNQMMQANDVDMRRAAGSSLHAMENHNNNSNQNVRNSLPVHLNDLRITEPMLDVEDTCAVEYHEINEEEASTSRRNRPETSSRRQKAKTAFMNFKSKLECATGHSASGKTQLNKVSNVNNNNNNNYNNNINNNSNRTSCTNHHSYSSIPQRHAVTGTPATMPPSAMAQQKQQRSLNNVEAVRTTITKTACNASSIYHDTPLRKLTSSNSTITTATTTPTPISITTTSARAIATATLPTTQPPIITATTAQATTTTSNPQLAIWTTNSKDVIISSINLLVCPSPSSSSTAPAATSSSTAAAVTLEHLMATELAAVSNTSATQFSSSSTAPTTLPPIATVLTATGPIVHSQVDFVHYLVPDLERIFNSSFYWGKMDRYEAERLLEGKPEGTFLLRDSAQEEYLFSVTFRKYGRSLHARIEQNGHKFSFDCHDPAVFSTSTVTGLLEHYKDPGSVMFFEPMLTVPFHRKTVFSLQQLARAAIVSNTSYDGITELELPVRLKAYLKEYHYKQKLRVKLLDETLLTCT